MSHPDDIAGVWRVHDEINRYLLEAISEGGFAALPLLKDGKPSTGRTVARQFAHLHEVRAGYIGREALKDVPLLWSGVEPSRAGLRAAFAASGQGSRTGSRVL